MVSPNFNNTDKNKHRFPISGSPSSASAITLAHLSDPHISCMQDITARDLVSKRLLGYLRWKLHRGTQHGSDVLSALQTDLKQTKPAHIAVTGDLTHLGLSAEFRQTRRWLRSLGPPSQVTVIPGNHDRYINHTWRDMMAYWTDYMRSDPPRDAASNTETLDRIFPSVRIRGHITIIGVSTARPSAPHLAVGSIGTLQLQKLEKILSQTSSHKFFRVMLIHHPPVHGVVSWRKRLTDAADLQSLLARRGVGLILHGHTHRAHQGHLKTPTSSIPVWGAPSISSLDSRPVRRARYYIYRISPGDCDWKIRQESRIYSPDQNCFITEFTQHLDNSNSGSC